MNNAPHQPPFREDEIHRVLDSDAGKKLLAYLNRDGGTALRQAVDALKNGKQADAYALMQPLMQTEEAKSLIDQINQK